MLNAEKHEKTEKDALVKAAGEYLREAGKAQEFKDAIPGTPFSYSASGTLFGSDGTSISISITKGTHNPKGK